LETRRCFIAIAFHFCFRYVIRNAQKKSEGLDLNRTHQLLVCADNVNILSENINTIKTQNLMLKASRKVGLEVSTEKKDDVYGCISSPEYKAESHFTDN
jgi:hypothetical protein